MANFRIAALVVAVAGTLAANAQRNLTESPQRSDATLIYKVSCEELRDLYLKGRGIDEQMLHTPVASWRTPEKRPALPRGNYLMVAAVGSNLQYNALTVDDLQYQVVGDRRLMLYLCDSLGQVIPGATIRHGMQTLRYDPATQTYNARRVPDGAVVEIGHDGVYHYVEFTRGKAGLLAGIKNTARKTWYRTRSVLKPKNDYNRYSFVVFSKPRYKPGEEVRLKAYVTNKNGKPLTGTADIRLTEVVFREKGLDTLLATVKPYRPGMYEFRFRLSDSLRMKLDKNYNISVGDVKGGFRYEEYELKNVTFTAKVPRGSYIAGDTIRLALRARDQNDMAVYDGRVSITVTANGRYGAQFTADRAFVPDVLWKHEQLLDGTAAETTVILPDSIFPAGVSLQCNVRCVLLNAENEKQESGVYFRRDCRTAITEFKADRGMLTVTRREGGKDIEAPAVVTALGREGEIADRREVALPYTAAIPWYVTRYEVAVGADTARYIVPAYGAQLFSADIARSGDTVRITVGNPAGIPFWYTVIRGRRVTEKGYGTSLDRTLRDNGRQAYALQLSYLSGGVSQQAVQTMAFSEKNLRMEVTAPPSVYPGQTTPVEIAVTDRRGRPVRNADITAWAVTSKFGMQMLPGHIQRKTKNAKYQVAVQYGAKDRRVHNRQGRLAWERWRGRMGLDTIEYYRFLHPTPVYAYSEPDPGGVTQIAPYLVVDGRLQGVEVIWIDEQPHYVHRAGQLEVYSFPVRPGRHTLRMKTRDREVVFRDAPAPEGMKTVLSVDAGGSEGDITVLKYNKKQTGVFTEKEKAALTPYMISVNGQFGTLYIPSAGLFQTPSVLSSGGALYQLGDGQGTRNARPVLAGPFPARHTGNDIIGYYNGTELINTFVPEGGYEYSIGKGYLKLKKWESDPFAGTLAPFTPRTDFGRHALTREGIDDRFREQIVTVMTRSAGQIACLDNRREYPLCLLRMETGRMKDGRTDVRPLMVSVVPADTSKMGWTLWAGGCRSFDLPEGPATLSLIFADTTSVSYRIDLRPGGVNFLRATGVETCPPDSLSRTAFLILEKNIRLANHYTRPADARPFPDSRTAGSYSRANDQAGVITGRICDPDGTPLIGATAVVEGTHTAAVTDTRGRFTLPYDPSKPGGTLRVSFIGYNSLHTEIKRGYDYEFYLIPASTSLEEVVVTGYGTRTRKSVTGSAATLHSSNSDLTASFAGKVAGVIGWQTGGMAGILTDEEMNTKFYVRGTSSFQANPGAEPLIIIDGLPASRTDLGQIAPENILSFDVLKDPSATAAYGSRGANGVIIVTTKGGIPAQQPAEGMQGMGMRRNFHDDAFWQPRLATDAQGKASFRVTWPDDITSWRASFVAVGGRRKTDATQLSVNSFKALTAQLALPQFAVRGDSLNAVGKASNHMPGQITATMTSAVDGIEKSTQVSFTTAHSDPIPVVAAQGDSVKVSYSLRRDNGYFDGEERTIPIYEQGSLQTHGQFALIGDDKTLTFTTDPALGEATIHAEASAMPVFLDEIEKVVAYPYMCNEQMASKIKALLARKHIQTLTGHKFDREAALADLISRLNRAANSDGLWGWWSGGRTEVWISRQVIEALLAAEKAGYTVNLDKRTLIDKLLIELNHALSSTDRAAGSDGYAYLYKGDIFDRLLLLRDLGAALDFQAYYDQADAIKEPKPSVRSKLQAACTMAALGVKGRYNVDSVRAWARHTMMGSAYWTEPHKDLHKYHLPYAGDTENTLLAYRTLRTMGGQDQWLEKTRNYFFEQRRHGRWTNTYESSRIIEMILPDMTAGGFSEVSATIDGRTADKFPYTATVPAGHTVSVARHGTAPLFLTVYQKAWNPAPKPESNGFHVRTRFVAGKDTAAMLTAGKPVRLEVRVQADSDADYVMVEVPVPAGCSYESKGRGGYNEVHREYFKEKVSIFCQRLGRGTHTFTVELIPRYTGLYHLNPARAELMYFPTFYGRGEMKKVTIE